MDLRVQSITTRSDDKVPLGNFNVLVGPNNSGKSQTLRDIRDYIATGSAAQLTIVKELDISLPTESDATKAFTVSPHTAPNHVMIRGVSYDLQSQQEFATESNWISQRFSAIGKAENVSGDVSEMLRLLGRFWVAHLDAESRLRIASPTPCYDTRVEVPSNAMQAFFAGGEAPLRELRDAFKNAFGADIALDWASMKNWYLMIGPDFGSIPDSRTALATLLKDARQLVAQGDGYRSFAGVVLAMLTFSNRLLLFDEPDAFLHPAQARVLGRWLATHAKEISSQIVLATHNADFLCGILSADSEATVIRLNRAGNITQYHSLDIATTKSLVESPLLSSQPVLDSLFQKGVVVCEGDPDRAVYQTVAHRYATKLGGEDVLFIHSNGKEALKNPVQMLRNAKTPVCAVVDLDIINSEQVLRDLLVLFATEPLITELLGLRTKIAEVVETASDSILITRLQSSVDEWRKKSYTELREARKRLGEIADKASKWKAIKATGVDYFIGPDRTQVDDFISKCAGIGLFVVPKGELEGWMNLGVSKGREWNRKALEDLHNGNCPDKLRQFVEAAVRFLTPTS
jgi:hypothetical protein